MPDRHLVPDNLVPFALLRLHGFARDAPGRIAVIVNEESFGGSICQQVLADEPTLTGPMPFADDRHGLIIANSDRLGE